MALTNATVAPRYGKALFEAARDNDRLESVQADLQAIQTIASTHPDLLKVLAAPTVPLTDKQTVVATLSQGADPLVHNLLVMLLDYGRIEALLLVIADYSARYFDALGLIEAQVTTATALTATQETALEQAIAKRFGAAGVTLVTRIDESLLGGVKMQIKDRVIDGSVKQRLAKLRAALLA